MINIAILEDNLFLQDYLAGLILNSQISCKVFQFSTNGEIRKHLEESGRSIDLLLADLDLPDGSGIQSIKLYKSLYPDGISVVISSATSTEIIIDAISNGAVGYLHKEDKTFEIINAIELALNGSSPMSPQIAFKLCSRIQRKDINLDNNSKSHPGQYAILTPRETEVLNLISRGLTYHEAAVALKISPNTLPVHIRNIYKKLQASNRSEAVYEARNMGIIP